MPKTQTDTRVTERAESAHSAVVNRPSSSAAQFHRQLAPVRYARALMLEWVENNAFAAELGASAPLLLWLLMARYQNVNWPKAHLEALLRSRRTKVLSAISGVGQPAALRWLSRVQLSSGEQAEYVALINALRTELYRTRWAREPAIPMHWISGAVEHLDLAHSRAYHSFCCLNPKACEAFNANLDQYARFWRDALSVAEAIGITDAEIALHRCQDFSAVRRLHDRWTSRLNQRLSKIVEGETRFPPAPVPGTENIHPISSLEDLQAEGRLMHHCVSVYQPKIHRGESYIYRMLGPERATIELECRGGRVRIGQLSLAYNTEPSQETIKAVNNWLNGALNGSNYVSG